MIVYSGKGYLVLLYFISGIVLTEIPCRGVFKDNKCFQNHPWIIFLGFFLGGLMCYATHLILGKIQRKNSDGIRQEHIGYSENNHSFFWVSIKKWSFILPAFGVLFSIIKSFG